jgi:T4 RnlA family RNA ligase
MNLPKNDEFNYKECLVGGDECWLIFPNKIGVTWTDENEMFRSIIIRKSDNYIVSRGFDKFYNLGEKPESQQDLINSHSIDYLKKEDGSLLIWSSHNGELLHRTRGTVNAEIMPNGSDIIFLREKYPKIKEWITNHSEYSLLTEWLTPNNIIVVSGYTEPELCLLGLIHNQTGVLTKYEDLPIVSEQIGVPLVPKYQYNTIKECVEDVRAWKGKEGVVVYCHSSGGKTTPIKIKSDWYLKLHKIASGITNIDNIIDIFLESPRYTKHEDFYKYVEQTLDYEIAEKIKPEIKQITEAYSKFLKKIDSLEESLVFVREFSTRKQMAEYIQQECNGWSLSLAFLLLDQKEIPNKMIFNSLKQIIDL